MNELQSILRRVHCDGCKDSQLYNGDVKNHEPPLDLIQAEIEIMDWVNRVIGAPNKSMSQQPCHQTQQELIHEQRLRAGI